MNNSLSSVGNPFPFNNQTDLQFGFGSDENAVASMFNARLRLRLNILNSSGTTTILRPNIAWIKNYTVTCTYKLGDGAKKTTTYSSQPARGETGFIYSLMNRSFNNTGMESYPENLQPRVVTGSSTEAIIPLMYLFDFAATERWLPLLHLQLQLSFDSQEKIFFSPGVDPISTLQVQIVSYNLEFPSAIATPYLDRALMYPDHRKTFDQITTWLVGEQSKTINISVSGKILEVFYWFKDVSSSTSTTPGSFKFNALPFEPVTYHQINISGMSFPLQPQYFAEFTSGGVEIGLFRHYDELLQNINKYTPQRNTFLTYETWRDSFRIYSIEMNNSHAAEATTMPLQIQLSSPASSNCSLQVTTRYVTL